MIDRINNFICMFIGPATFLAIVQIPIFWTLHWICFQCYEVPHLDATTAVFVLANLDLAIYEKEMMTRVALALGGPGKNLSFCPVPWLLYIQPLPCTILVDQIAMTLICRQNATLGCDYETLAEMELPPCLSEFNGEESWLVFDLLGHGKAEVSWLLMPSEFWIRNPYSKSFKPLSPRWQWWMMLLRGQ